MILFFDVNVGTVVPRILKNELKLPVEYHVAHFPIDAPDDQWLATVGAWGWMVIGHDSSFHIRQNELSAIKQHGVGCFYFWGAEATRWQKLQCFALAYDRIVKADNTPKPFIYRITRSGLLKRVPIP